jgi:RNA polymerase sigma-70 factor, ECF subfamily
MHRSMPGLDDEDLVLMIAAGDREAFGELYDRYAAALLSQARRILRSQDEAEDLVHDLYLEVWRCAHTYESSRGTVRAWLAVRTRSRALDRLKTSHHARRSFQDVNDLVELSAPEPESALAWDTEAVRRSLDGLSADQRKVLELFYFDGLSLPEISELLDVPLGTVKSRASRAIGKLRAELGEAGAIGAA